MLYVSGFEISWIYCSSARPCIRLLRYGFTEYVFAQSLSHLLPYLLCKKGGHVTLHEKRGFPVDSTHGWCIVAMVNFLVSRMVAPLILRSWETRTMDEISRKADIWLIYLLSLQDQIVSWSNRFCVHWKLGAWVKRNLVSGLQPFENREFICS